MTPAALIKARRIFTLPGTVRGAAILQHLECWNTKTGLQQPSGWKLKDLALVSKAAGEEGSLSFC